MAFSPAAFSPGVMCDPWGDYGRVSKYFDEGFIHRMRMRNMMQLDPSVHHMTSYVSPWHHFDIKQNEISRIETDKDNFKVVMDVQHFTPYELTVKTVLNEVIIEGKHEEKEDEHGQVSRHFVRRYQLPEGIKAESVTSTLSSDGMMTVSAPRNPPLEQENVRAVPITLIKGPAVRNVGETVKNVSETVKNVSEKSKAEK